VLILGAAGATGLAAVDVAKRQVGATVIAVGRSADKLAVVDGPRRRSRDRRSATRRCATRCKAIAPDGVDVVYDGVGGELSLAALALRAVRRALPDRRLGRDAARAPRKSVRRVGWRRWFDMAPR
jgi:NADPH-dependent curcumin reductase CurA